MNAEPSPASANATYSYRPSVAGAAWQFTLTGDALEFQAGRKGGLIQYRNVRRVRLSFRPSATFSDRFITEIWAAGAARKIEIVSLSWKSLFEQERRDTDYSAFVAEFHRRLATANAPTRFDLGVHPAIYWAGAVISVIVGLSLAGLVLRGIEAQFWAGTAFVTLFFAAFIWQSANYFRRNKPGHYRPDALPPDLLPKSQ